MVHAPDIKSQFEVLGYTTVGGSPEEFATFMRAESQNHAKAAQLSGAKVD